MYPYQLDFNISDAAERTALVNKIINTTPNLTEKDYDLFTTYIVCGSTNETPSPVQQHSIYLEGDTRQTHQARKTQSLDELLETPTFNEGSLRAIDNPTIYKIPRPNFSRQRAIDQGLELQFRDLWERIDALDRLVALKQGKQLDPPPTQLELSQAARITSLKLYKLKKLIIELRKEQYTLNDNFNPPLQNHNPQQVAYRGAGNAMDDNWSGWNIAPLGLYNKAIDWWSEPWRATKTYMPIEDAPVTIDFSNAAHIYHLIEFREEMEQSALDNCESPIPLLYQTLDWYAGKAHLNGELCDLMALKTKHCSNKFIADYLNKKYEVKHSEPYISTMYTKQLCNDIAQAAQLHWDTYVARNNPTKFKKCRDCAETLLMDPRNFTRSSRSRDGYSCRCKRCEKKKRQ